MKILLPIFLFTLCTAVLSQDSITDSTDGTTAASQDTTVSDASTATTEPSTVTDAPTPTAEPTTTSDVSSVTTPAASSTTTRVSTTSSTTAAPVTTASPTTTTKAPEPEKCLWNVTESGVTCILAELKAEFIIPIEDKKYTIILGCNASSLQSTCLSNETQTLKLSEPNYYNLTMIFEKEDNNVFVRNVTFAYNLTEGQGVVSNNSETIFKVKAGNSYLCKSELDVNLENVTMKITEIHIQAFGENFGSAEECEADDKVSDIVPIAVGVALGALIIIVLIAYLVGRRRSRQKGYQSV